MLFKVLQKKSSAQDNEMYPLKFKENREYNSNGPPMIGDLPVFF